LSEFEKTAKSDVDIGISMDTYYIAGFAESAKDIKETFHERAGAGLTIFKSGESVKYTSSEVKSMIDTILEHDIRHASLWKFNSEIPSFWWDHIRYFLDH